MPPFSVAIEQIQTLGCELEVCGNRLDLYVVGDQDADPDRLKPLLTVLRNHKTEAVAWLQKRTLVKTELERGIRAAKDYRDLETVCGSIDAACLEGDLDQATVEELTGKVRRCGHGLPECSDDPPPIWAETLLADDD